MGYFGDNLDQLGGKTGIAKNLAVTRLKQVVKPILGRKMVPHEDHPKWKGLDKLSQALYNETHYTILPTLLRNYDRYSMANGVEIQMPFMDWRIVTFAFSLPWDSKVGGGFTKRIVRDAMAPFMPAQIAYRKTKIGFNSPVVEWFQGPLKSWLMEMFHSQEFLDCPLIEGRNIAGEGTAILNSTNMSWADGEKLWMKITPYLWEKAVVRGGKNV